MVIPLSSRARLRYVHAWPGMHACMHAIYACVRCVAAPVCAWLDGTERSSGAVRGHGKALPSAVQKRKTYMHG